MKCLFTVFSQKWLMITVIAGLLMNCQSSKTDQINDPELETKSDSNWLHEKAEVKRAAEELLFHVGNYNFDAMRAGSLPEANIGMASIVDGVPKGRSMTLQQYFDLVSDNPIPYYEPSHRYTIEVSKGRLAL